MFEKPAAASVGAAALTLGLATMGTTRPQEFQSSESNHRPGVATEMAVAAPDSSSELITAGFGIGSRATEWLGDQIAQGIVQTLVGVTVGAAGATIISRRLARREFERGQAYDYCIAQTHQLVEQSDGSKVLLFRTVGLADSLREIIDNETVSRDLVRTARTRITLHSPLVPMDSQADEVVYRRLMNRVSAANSTGEGAITNLLCFFTCEDPFNRVTRQSSFRLLMISPELLAQFRDWSVVMNYRVEAPSSWFRLVCLHQLARDYFEGSCSSMSNARLVQIPMRNDFTAVGEPCIVDWENQPDFQMNRRAFGLHSLST